MKTKIIAILVSILFLTVIPSAIGDIVELESDMRTTNLDVGRGFCIGVGLFPHRSGNTITFFAIWLFHKEFVFFEWVTLKDSSAFLAGKYTIQRDLVVFVFGFFMGGLEIAP